MLVKFELRKILSISVVLLFVLVFGIKLLTIHISTASIDVKENTTHYYIIYLKQFEGPLTKEKRRTIEGLRKFIDDTISSQEEQKIKYTNNEISKEEYDQYLSNLNYCRQRRESFNMLYDDYMYIQAQKAANPFAEPEFVYTGYWRKLLNPSSFDIVLWCILIIVLTNITTLEYSSEMIFLLHSSQNGRMNTVYAKMIAGGIVTYVMSLLSTLAETIFYITRCYLPNSDASIQSIDYYGGFSLGISLKALAILGVIIKPVTAVVISQLFILLGQLIKNRNIIIITTLCLLFVPLFIATVVPAVYAYLPPSILNFYNIIRYAGMNHAFFVQILLLFVIILIYVVLILYLIRRNKKAAN